MPWPLPHLGTSTALNVSYKVEALAGLCYSITQHTPSSPAISPQTPAKPHPQSAKMKFTALTSLLAATAVSAVPTPEQTAADVKAFNLMSLRSASPIHFGSFSATKSSIFINLPAGKQGATCEGDPKGVATFSLKDGQLFLYDGRSTDPQQIFVDRSGMGKFYLQPYYNSGGIVLTPSRPGQDRIHHRRPTGSQEQRAQGLGPQEERRVRVPQL